VKAFHQDKEITLGFEPKDEGLPESSAVKVEVGVARCPREFSAASAQRDGFLLQSLRRIAKNVKRWKLKRVYRKHCRDQSDFFVMQYARPIAPILVPEGWGRNSRVGYPPHSADHFVVRAAIWDGQGLRQDGEP